MPKNLKLEGKDLVEGMVFEDKNGNRVMIEPQQTFNELLTYSGEPFDKESAVQK